jgi:hypothetical protein
VSFIAKTRMPVGIASVLLPACLTALFWSTSQHEVTPLSILCTFVLLLLPWMDFVRWQRGPKEVLPLFPMIGCMYVFAYIFPLFWGRGALWTPWLGDVKYGPESLERSMLLAAIGVFSYWLGMEMCPLRKLVPRFGLGVAPTAYAWNYIRFSLAIGTALIFVDPLILGNGGRNVIIIVQNLLPTTAFALLYQRYLRGQTEKADVLYLLVYVAVRLITGLVSGWLGSATAVGLVVAVVYIYERGRVPYKILAIALLGIVFLQPGKGLYREMFWYSGHDAGVGEKLSYWIDASVTKWSESLSGNSSSGDLARETVARFSLLEQSTNVLQMTPSVVPYQYGHLYSFMFITLIPRAVWPSKPSVNEANQFYQVTYGLTKADNLSHVAIAVGTLTESYISFGWIGVVFIMFLVGSFVAWLRETLLRVDSGLLFNAVGISLVPGLLVVESMMAQYVAGLAQSILLVLLLLSPASKKLPRARVSG